MQEIAWQAMGLTQDPFPDHGPDEIFLQTPALGQRLSLFTQLAQASDLTLLLVGERGIGKTTFLGRIAHLLEEGWHIANLSAHRETTSEAVHEQLHHALAAGFPSDGSATLDDASLNGKLETLAADGYRTLVVVDDAHLLEDRALVQLLELGQHVRLALAGEPPLAQRITAVSENMASSDAGLVHRIVLGELNSPQTTDYLRARLSRSGYTETTPFTSEVCGQIYQRSRGVPGTINALASEFLELDPIASDGDGVIELGPHSHDTATVKAKLTTHAPIQPRISLHTGPSHQSLLRHAKPVAALTMLIMALGAAGYGILGWLSADTPDVAETPKPDSAPAVSIETDAPYPELPAAPAPPPPSVLADTAAPLVETLPTVAAAPDSPAPADNSASEDVQEVVANLNLARLTETPASETNTRDADPDVLPRPRRAPRQRRDEVEAASLAPAVVETRPTPTATATERTGASTWLESGDKDRFTVQLIALVTADAARQYIKRYQLADALIVSLKTPDAKPLFAVVHGVYDRRERALDAIRRMPAPVRRAAPWPRHIGTLLEAAHEVRAR
jgi:DamX protein